MSRAMYAYLVRCELDPEGRKFSFTGFVMVDKVDCQNIVFHVDRRVKKHINDHTKDKTAIADPEGCPKGTIMLSRRKWQGG